ncbi:hypothetical protein Hdeb2414_s0015g00437251 [Helianthus debilis subsp. tardiflorus]
MRVCLFYGWNIGRVSFVWESMPDDISMVFAYYKEGATDPAFCTLVWG